MHADLRLGKTVLNARDNRAVLFDVDGLYQVGDKIYFFDNSNELTARLSSNIIQAYYFPIAICLFSFAYSALHSQSYALIVNLNTIAKAGIYALNLDRKEFKLPLLFIGHFGILRFALFQVVSLFLRFAPFQVVSLILRFLGRGILGFFTVGSMLCSSGRSVSKRDCPVVSQHSSAITARRANWCLNQSSSLDPSGLVGRNSIFLPNTRLAVPNGKFFIDIRNTHRGI